MKQSEILVIDDELGVRAGCQRVLEASGHQVTTASDVQQGLELIQAHDYDLVLLDVMMPDGRGIDLLAPMIEKDPDQVAIIITGYATIEMAVEATKAGAYDFISKPFTSDTLLMKVAQGLEKRQLSQETRRLQHIEREAAELARTKAEMERLDQYKTAFMLTVAHELRSPVSGAQSLVRTMVRGLAGEVNAQQQDILNRVNKRLDGLLELINDLLSLAASKTFDAEVPLEILNVQGIIQELVEQFEVQAAEKKINLTLQEAGNDLQVRASLDGLQKIFGNLISNAVKYTPEGGRVSISLEKRDGFLVGSVQDTGIGISKEELPLIFAEFYRTQASKAHTQMGTGLGLTIVKRILETYGGEISVESESGQGSRFTFKMPIP